MIVVGPALIGRDQQRRLAEGATLEIAKSCVYADAADRARVGDLWWVREPYVEYVAKSGRFLGIARGFGPLAKISKELSRSLPFRVSGGAQINDYRHVQMTGQTLARADSWTCLEITDKWLFAGQHLGWRCLVHMSQVDAFLKARAA